MSGVTRYVIHPGTVRSAVDGQRQYVGAASLIALYGLPRGAHIWIDGDDTLSAGRVFQPAAGDVHLHPRADGVYTLPE